MYIIAGDFNIVMWPELCELPLYITYHVSDNVGTLITCVIAQTSEHCAFIAFMCAMLSSLFVCFHLGFFAFVYLNLTLLFDL